MDARTVRKSQTPCRMDESAVSAVELLCSLSCDRCPGAESLKIAVSGRKIRNFRRIADRDRKICIVFHIYLCYIIFGGLFCVDLFIQQQEGNHNETQAIIRAAERGSRRDDGA